MKTLSNKQLTLQINDVVDLLQIISERIADLEGGKDIEETRERKDLLDVTDFQYIEEKLEIINFRLDHPFGYCCDYSNDLPFAPEIFAFYYNGCLKKTNITFVNRVLKETDIYYILEIKILDKKNIVKLDKRTLQQIDITDEWEEISKK